MNLAEANHILRLTDTQLALVSSINTPGRSRQVPQDHRRRAEQVDDATVAAVVETVLSTIVDR